MQKPTFEGIRDVAIRWKRGAPVLEKPSFVAVRECAEPAQWEASFEMRLESVVPALVEKRRKRVEAKDPLLESLALGLASRQQVDLVFRSRGSPRGPAWSVVGRCRGPDSDSVLRAGETLRQAVSSSLEPFGRSLRFRPVADTGTTEGWGWHTTLAPGGVALPRSTPRRMGFLTQNPTEHGGPTTVTLTPAPPENSSRAPSGVAALFDLSAPIQATVSFRPVFLEPGQMRALADAYEWLLNGEPKRLGVGPALGVSLEDPGTLERLKRSLEGWLRSGRGFRVQCELLSRDPVPPGVLSLLGQDLFEGGTFESSATRVGVGAPSAQRRGTASPLDLRGCHSSGFALPRFLPREDALLRAGFPKEHATVVGTLPTRGLLLGCVSDGVTKRDVRLPEADRSRHAYLIGATGTGKSTLLHRMVVDDMDADRGVCLIDPHGDLYQQVLESVPARRTADVVLIDASDFGHPVGINLLECEGAHLEVQQNFATNEMIRIFDRLYNLRETGGPIFEQYVRMALLLIMDSDYPGATLMDVPWLFEDHRYRRFLKEKCRSPLVVSFWDDQAEKAGGEASLANIVPYVTSKFNQFVTNALLRPIIGQPKSTVDFRRAMDRSKIVLVNLSKGLLGELDARLLGMLVLGKLFKATLGRAAVPPNQRTPFYLYVDEFQNVTTDTLGHMLAEARKYGLHLTLANQNLGQLVHEDGRSLHDAVLANVGTLVTFRLGPADAEKLQTYTRPELDAQGLQELPNFHAAARLLVDGAPLRPFVFQTLPTQALLGRARVRHLVEGSRRRNSRPRAEVEAAILARRKGWEK